MISLVLYGRNDSYGYNLHKRAALSLNCMAEVLRAPGDEILFVDYNTPSDFPTFPEAIEDTLTERARKMLRIFRVRPEIHARYKEKTHLVALEPIARNVAVRRSLATNRWILSTNTDMIFLPRGAASLDAVAGDLPSGFYHLPRFEIPESLWEGFNRSAPEEVFAALRHWGPAAHLNEIVRGSEIVRYDAPGDFQLVERRDLFEIGGFHEGMLRGWHVDSNLSKRLLLKHGKIGTVLDGFFGYHCDHTRQVTPMHRPDRVENSIATFVDEVKESAVEEQAAAWGLAGDDIEEVRLDRSASRLYMGALARSIRQPMAAPTEVSYVGEEFDKVDYDPPHVLPFVLDIFVNLRRGSRIAWRGMQKETFRLFREAWTGAEFGGTVLLEAAEAAWLGAASSPSVRILSWEEVQDEADAFVFDFGGAKEMEGQDLFEGLALTLRDLGPTEQARAAAGRASRRIVVLNAINNRYESMARSYLATAATPFSSRIRQGYAVASLLDWLSRLSVGKSGVREGGVIRVQPGVEGTVFYGPYLYIPAGRYRVTMRVSGAVLPVGWGKMKNSCGMRLEAVDASFFLGIQFLTWGDLKKGAVTFDFHIHGQVRDLLKSGIELRLQTAGRTPLTVESVQVEPLDPLGPAVLLPLYRLSEVIRISRLEGGRRSKQSAIRPAGLPPGRFLSGGHMRLVRGRYRLQVATSRNGELRVEAVLAGQTLAGITLPPSRRSAESALEFHIDGAEADSHTFEVCVHALDEGGTEIKNMLLEQLE